MIKIDEKNNEYDSELHSISSYLAMFNKRMPEKYIKKFTNEGDIVYDLFSGRGTTLLQSRLMKRIGIGSDLNPYAYVLSKFKCVKINNKDDLINRVKELENEYNKLKKIYDNKIKKINKELFYYYSEKNLSQILFLKEQIGIKWKNLNNIDISILAFSLGIMHGSVKKDGSSIYFSVSMPNTISMSPNYVKNYVKKNNLKKIENNIFELIINRINKKYDPILEKEYEGFFFYWDATNKKENFIEGEKLLEQKKIKLVFTSPPYLNIVDYTNSNWLKLWMLGFERKELRQKIKLNDKFSDITNYSEFIKKILNNLYDLLDNSGIVCLVVGDIKETKLINEVWEQIKNKVNYEQIEIREEKILDNKKSTRLLNKNANATKIERILILKKIQTIKNK